jgi:hypothetical protein
VARDFHLGDDIIQRNMQVPKLCGLNTHRKSLHLGEEIICSIVKNDAEKNRKK